MLLLLTLTLMVVVMSQVKVVRGRVECQARVVMTVGVLLAIILATVWESVFTPDVHLASDSGNSTVSTSFIITGHPPPLALDSLTLHQLYFL